MPEGSLKRYAGALCAVLTGAMLLLPAGGRDEMTFPQPEEFTFDTGEAQQQINEEVLNYVENQLCDSFKAEARERGVKITRVEMEIRAESVSDVRVGKIMIGDSLGESEKQVLTLLAGELFESGVTVIFEAGHG